MQLPDAVNGAFELFGALAITSSIVKLHNEKSVRGVSWIMVLFFWSWGVWNLYYYPHLGQSLSFLGGIGTFTANLIYLTQLIYYRK